MLAKNKQDFINFFKKIDDSRQDEKLLYPYLKKTHEISAINDILDEINIEKTTVSIGAIGAQKSIVDKIIAKGGNYFISLKGNQSSLLSDVESMFNSTTCKPEVYSESEKSHGRIETRTCKVLGNINWLKARHIDWKNLTSIAKVISVRNVKGIESITERYYISSESADAKKHLKKSRNHWSIENNLHWILDVQFNEDSCLIRKDNAAENMSAIRKLVLNIIKNYKVKNKVKRSINDLRQRIGWSDAFMEKVLNSWVYNCP